MIKKKNNQKLKIYLLMIPSISIAIIFTFIPFIKTVENSFSVVNDVHNYSDKNFGVHNFVSIFNDPIFKIAIKNTSFILFIIAPASLCIFFLVSIAINSISFKIFKNSFISLIFSQFFISSYAIGISFMVLFSQDNNVLNSILKTNIPFDNSDNKNGALLSLAIFFFWRISAISMVLFIFSFNKINQKLFLIGKVDKIGFIKKISIIYLPNIKNTLYVIIYIYIFESLFFYPTIFKNADLVNGQTLMFYIIDKFNSTNTIQWTFGSAASIVLFLYSTFLVLFILLTKFIIKKYKMRMKVC